MDEHAWLAERFDEHRTRLRAVALQDAGVKKDSDFNRASLSVVGSVVRSSVDFRRQWAASRACRRISARVPTPGWARVVRRAGAGASKLAYCPGTLDVRFPRKQWRDRVDSSHWIPRAR